MAISIVQQVSGTGTSISFSSPTTAGNCVIVGFGDLGSVTPAVTAVTLGGSADNFAAAVTASNSTGHVLAAIWADPNCAGGQTAIAVTESNTASPVIFALEVSGLAASGVADKSSTGTGNATSWSSGTTATTTKAAELWIGIVTLPRSPTGPGSPWTNTAKANGSSNSLLGTQITTATGTATYNGTVSLASNYAAAVVTLLPAATNVSVALTTAQVTAAAPAPVPSVSVPLSTAQVTITARPVTPVAGAGVVLPAAAVTIAARAPAVTFGGGLTLPAAAVAAAAHPVTPALGGRVLLCSMAASAGVDRYGNPYPAGCYINTGLLYGTTLLAQSVGAGVLAPNAVDAMTMNAVTINSGTVSASDVIISGLAGGAFAYSSGGTITEILTGASTFTIPAGVTSYKLEGWGNGAGGAGSNTGTGDAAGGGGGAEYVRYNSLTATPGAVISYDAGTPGAGGGDNTNGGDGANAVWDTTGARLTAHGGKGGHSSFGIGGAGGTGNTDADAHFDGGAGATASPTALGGGGGGSGGSSAKGIDGTQSTGGSGSGAPAVTDGGPGGDGGDFADSNGQAPAAGPGGGGGGAATTGAAGGDGQAGWFRVTYTSSSPQLIASIAGAATTDPVAGTAVPEGIATDHLSVTSTGSTPSTPSGRAVLYYESGSLWALGPSGTPVKLATT